MNTSLAVEYKKKTLIIKQASEDSGSLSIHMYQKHPQTQIYLSSCTTEVKIAPKTREALRFLAFGLNFHAISASDRFNFLCWSIVVKVRNSEGIVSPIFWLQKDDLDCLGSCFTTISTSAGDVKSYL